MDEKIRKTITDLNAHLADMPYKLDLVDPRVILLLDKNARYMTQEMFENLVNNIKSDGGLSSLPLCYQEKDGRLLVLSGNHRVQAAVHAGLEEILVLVIDKELTRQELSFTILPASDRFLLFQTHKHMIVQSFTRESPRPFRPVCCNSI
jgi:hypothetical protein